MIHGIARVMRTAASDVVEDQRLDMTVSKALLFSFITSCPIRMHIVPLKSDEVNQGRNTIRWHQQIVVAFVSWPRHEWIVETGGKTLQKKIWCWKGWNVQVGGGDLADLHRPGESRSKSAKA